MKFKSSIEVQAGIKDNSGNLGASGEVLSSTGSGVEWLSQNAISASSNFIFYDVKNSSGFTINKGKAVMAVGTDGNSGHILVDEMVADGSVESRYFMGVLEETLINGGFGRVIAFGELDQFNTLGQNGETWVDGQVLWCDPDSIGDFTITEPLGPNLKIPAAFIMKAATNGKIQIRVQGNEGIKDLYDTKIASQADGDVLVWNNTTGVWFNNSTLKVDYTNNRIGIGTTAPVAKLQVEANGSNIARFGDDFGNNVALTIENASNVAKIRYDQASDGAANKNLGFFSGVTERMRITSAGNLGIGTTNPLTKLDVYNVGGFTEGLTNTYGSSVIRGFNITPAINTKGILDIEQSGTTASANTGATLTFSNNTWIFGRSYTRVCGSIKSALETSTNQSGQSSLVFSTTNPANILEEKMRIRSSGNIGIGTTNPLTKLHLQKASSGFSWSNYVDNIAIFENNSDAIVSLISPNNRNTEIWFGDADLQSAGRVRYEHLTNALAFYNNGSEKMRINIDGNLGIGTTAPTSKIHAVGLPSYADNSAALAGGLTVGAFYHTSGTLKVVI